jgi:hypothetical protein
MVCVWLTKRRNTYEKFLSLWKDANPGIAEIEDTRERGGWIEELVLKGIFKLFYLILELANKFIIQIDSYPRAQRTFSEVHPYRVVH